jgi:FAM183A and FAM183B related
MSSTHEEIYSLKKKLEVLTSIPKKKYPFPVTAAQEVGWDNDELFHAHRPKYAYNKGSCAETKYANDYVIMTHKSPFLNNKKLDGPAGAAPKK